MLVKLKQGLQIKNHLGIDPKDLPNLVQDKQYNYLRSPTFKVSVEKRGEVLALQTVPLNVHKDYMALVIPNPELSMHGIVWGNSFWTDDCQPIIYLKASKVGDIELDYLYDLRLIS